jgi:hypothetical protein
LLNNILIADPEKGKATERESFKENYSDTVSSDQYRRYHCRRVRKSGGYSNKTMILQGFNYAKEIMRKNRSA